MKNQLQHPLRILLPIVALFLIGAQPAQAAKRDIQPQDVYQLVSVVSEEIERLRWYMGRPKLMQPPPAVTNVSPHEVYDQAVTLFHKADRLAFELTLEEGELPAPTSEEITPANVYAVIKEAHRRLLRVNKRLGIMGSIKFLERDASRTPTDVFQLVIQSNRQLNLMIAQPFSPSDAYRQVTLAISYADSILRVLPISSPPPRPLPITPGKRPVDVYQRLLEAFNIVCQIGHKLDLEMLQLTKWTDDDKDIRPSDVFDVASLVVSELAYIHKQIPDTTPPRKVRRVRGKFPSDVYQRVEVLEQILKEVLQRL